MAKHVQTKFRKHILSFIPGGCVIILTHKNGESFIYDKIKYPKAYLEKALKNPSIKTAYLNNEIVWAEPEPKMRRLIPFNKAA